MLRRKTEQEALFVYNEKAVFVRGRDKRVKIQTLLKAGIMLMLIIH